VNHRDAQASPVNLHRCQSLHICAIAALSSVSSPIAPSAPFSLLYL
jgi:hypothetical protein